MKLDVFLDLQFPYVPARCTFWQPLMVVRGEGANLERFNLIRGRFLIAAAVEVWITIVPDAKLSLISNHPLEQERLGWRGNWNVTALFVSIS